MKSLNDYLENHSQHPVSELEVFELAGFERGSMSLSDLAYFSTNGAGVGFKAFEGLSEDKTLEVFFIMSDVDKYLRPGFSLN